ncbi:hypothetical protein [Arsenophonus endosymbiont of Aleurodicus floccissimus]|uniref:hypothetical protein n=1 Tax=Arsenophonus endosymbiont of Aleurodicus floccissimus TaxID=2152761 RepID=UPI001EE0C66B|nr:hypothetical protein [Arsenophonus endosymbiont of Aleurodicus floccissimus]
MLTLEQAISQHQQQLVSWQQREMIAKKIGRENSKKLTPSVSYNNAVNVYRKNSLISLNEQKQMDEIAQRAVLRAL